VILDSFKAFLVFLFVFIFLEASSTAPNYYERCTFAQQSSSSNAGRFNRIQRGGEGDGEVKWRKQLILIGFSKCFNEFASEASIKLLQDCLLALMNVVND
jgi:hypothetical protein